jgi:hypothetical protein
LNAPFLFESWQLLPFKLCFRCNTGGNRWSPPLLGNDGAATVPVDFNESSEVDLHQYKAVLVLGEKAENFTACHQFACGWKDNADAEVFGVALNLYAVEVRGRAGVAIHELVYGGACENGHESGQKSTRR